MQLAPPVRVKLASRAGLAIRFINQNDEFRRIVQKVLQPPGWLTVILPQRLTRHSRIGKRWRADTGPQSGYIIVQRPLQRLGCVSIRS